MTKLDNSTMKWFILAAYLGFYSVSYAKLIERTEISQAACDLSYDGSKISLQKIPEAKRPEVVEMLRRISNGEITAVGSEEGSTVANQKGAILGLVTLGDEQTLQKLIQIYRTYNSRSAWDYIPETFRFSKNPKVISYLAEDFDLNEPVTAFYGGKDSEETISVPPRSIYSGVISLRIIRKSDKMSAEMRDWSKQAEAFRAVNPEGFRRMMRAWWQENKAAFAKGDYLSVKPIDLQQFEKEPKPTPDPGPTPLAAKEEPAPTPSPVVHDPMKPAPVVVATLEPPACPSTNWFLILSSVASGLLATAVVIRLFKK
jgi:hypothetical protein